MKRKTKSCTQFSTVQLEMIGAVWSGNSVWGKIVNFNANCKSVFFYFFLFFKVNMLIASFNIHIASPLTTPFSVNSKLLEKKISVCQKHSSLHKYNNKIVGNLKKYSINFIIIFDILNGLYGTLKNISTSSTWFLSPWIYKHFLLTWPCTSQ